MSSGGLRNTSYSNKDEVGANYKFEYLLLHPSLLIHIVVASLIQIFNVDFIYFSIKRKRCPIIIIQCYR